MLAFYLSLVDTDEDRSKVAGIYKRYYGLMRYVAEQTLGDKKDAAPDIVHDAMLKIIDNPGALDLSGGDNTKSLCLVIVRNKCKDYLRKKGTNTVPLDDCDIEDKESPLPDEVVVSEENVIAVKRAIKSLGKIYYDVCVMKYVLGYKVTEIAELLSVPPGTVKSRLNRVRKELSKELQGD